jgi:hypothetical protein
MNDWYTGLRQVGTSPSIFPPQFPVFWGFLYIRIQQDESGKGAFLFFVGYPKPSFLDDNLRVFESRQTISGYITHKISLYPTSHLMNIPNKIQIKNQPSKCSTLPSQAAAPHPSHRPTPRQAQDKRLSHIKVHSRLSMGKYQDIVGDRQDMQKVSSLCSCRAAQPRICCSLCGKKET